MLNGGFLTNPPKGLSISRPQLHAPAPINEPQVNNTRIFKEVNIIEENPEDILNKGKMEPTIISYYSDFVAGSTYYKDFAIKLMDRCQEFKVNSVIEEIESRGSYGNNCLMKPGFILGKLKSLKRPLIWMDCDTDFKEPFSNFNNVQADIGMATHSGDMEGIKASPILFSYTIGAFRILREWFIHNNRAYEKDLPELDHDALKHYVLPELNGQYSIYLLRNNWQDFCNGRYINNGNSFVPGKREIHKAAMGYGDENRKLVTLDVPTIIVNIITNDDPELALDTLYNWMELFSNKNRIYFNIVGNSSDIIGLPKFDMLSIESGGFLKISDTCLEIEDSLFTLNLSPESLSIKDWDILIIESIKKEVPAEQILENNKIEIKINGKN